jgi:hypothetical protein
MPRRLTDVVHELDAFLAGESAVHRTLEALARRLSELDVEFALAGGLAVAVRGHERLTVGVDVLIASEGLTRFRTAWLGRGYVERFPGSRSVRDTETGVAIDFLVAGDYPGDGRTKSVRFPNPGDVPRGDGPFRVVDLRTLIELKLAAGLLSPDRLQDLADVLALIRANHLDLTVAEALDVSVREKYHELWHVATTPPRQL